MAKRLTQCEIHNAETNFESAIKEFEEANFKMLNSVEALIKMIAKLDKSLFEFEEYMAINYIDGDMLYNYVVKTIEVEEDGTIIVNCDDVFDTEQTSFEFDNLSTDEIRCLGSMLYDAYKKKYGERLTYKDMVELSKKK